MSLSDMCRIQSTLGSKFVTVPPLHKHTYTHVLLLGLICAAVHCCSPFPGHMPITLAEMKACCCALSKACSNSLGHCLLWPFNTQTLSCMQSGFLEPSLTEETKEEGNYRAAPPLAVSQGGLLVESWIWNKGKVTRRFFSD
ncbi:hypothetical protein XENOCAPTIV_005730 [Xenoophorus captivus]|uniref:Uncharacterized protein n=1 Tax=Xenoophorus captivus TaxID=1517983 RepID=A0ABV0QQ79_9TELE